MWVLIDGRRPPIAFKWAQFTYFGFDDSKNWKCKHKNNSVDRIGRTYKMVSMKYNSLITRAQDFKNWLIHLWLWFVKCDWFVSIWYKAGINCLVSVLYNTPVHMNAPNAPQLVLLGIWPSLIFLLRNLRTRLSLIVMVTNWTFFLATCSICNYLYGFLK